MTKNFRTIILAAGKGVRMKSDLPKVLHKVKDMPMIQLVVITAKESGSEETYVVVGYQEEKIRDLLKDEVIFVLQKEQLGTGHAVQQTFSNLQSYKGDVLVLSGDVPNITVKTIQNLVSFHQDSGSKATVLSAKIEYPTGYGRIVRDKDNNLEKIVEEKDASDKEKKIDEINSGTYLFGWNALFSALNQVNNDNKQKEYYLTDTLQIIKKNGGRVSVVVANNSHEVMGVNTKQELKDIEGTKVL